MEVTIKDKKLSNQEPKTFHFDLPKGCDNSLKHGIYFIIKYSDFLADNTKKAKLFKTCSNITMETKFMNTKNSKTNEPHRFFS